MKTVSAGIFKTHCLFLLKEVSQKHQKILVTKYGKPLVHIVPVPKNDLVNENPLKDSIIFEENIVDPIDEIWEVNE